MVLEGHVRSSTRRATILVVEDEVRSQRLVRLNLEPLGFRVITSSTAQGIPEMVMTYGPDLVILDLKLPDGDGFQVCQQIRSMSSVPIVILSAFGQAADKVRGFELGADDYITKPYDASELAARVDAVLRRVQGQPLQKQTLFHAGPLKVDYEQRLVTVDGEAVHLSRTEYRLLEYLAQNAGRVLVNDALLAKVWGPEYMGDHASLHLYISRLRRKLGEAANRPRLIITKSGIGYMLATLPSETKGDAKQSG